MTNKLVMPNISGPEVTHSTAGWRTTPELPSLSEVHRSLVVPPSASFFRKLLAFAGPGFLVAVGYMDPGNWATDLAGGSKYNYSLLAVIMMSNLMAILLQALSLKLGIATGRDLAQACRDHYSKPVSFFLCAGLRRPPREWHSAAVLRRVQPEPPFRAAI